VRVARWRPTPSHGQCAAPPASARVSPRLSGAVGGGCEPRSGRQASQPTQRGIAYSRDEEPISQAKGGKPINPFEQSPLIGSDPPDVMGQGARAGSTSCLSPDPRPRTTIAARSSMAGRAITTSTSPEAPAAPAVRSASLHRTPAHKTRDREVLTASIAGGAEGWPWHRVPGPVGRPVRVSGQPPSAPDEDGLSRESGATHYTHRTDDVSLSSSPGSAAPIASSSCGSSRGIRIPTRVPTPRSLSKESP